jgi:hypothetical protein
MGKISHCSLLHLFGKMVDITKYSKWTLLIYMMETFKH